MAKSVSIAAVGEIVQDVYLPEEDRYLGGISANFARAALRSGAEVTLYGAVGDDEPGRRLRALLETKGLGKRVRALPGKTAEQRIKIGDRGERVFCGFDPGVMSDYRLSDDERAALTAPGGPDVLALCASIELIALFASCLTLELRSDQRLVADFSPDSPLGPSLAPESWIAPYIDRLAVAFVGGERGFVDRLAPLTEGKAALIVVTAGADGAYVCKEGKIVHQPALATEVVDTTGCGDAFQGGFTAAWAAGAELAAALRTGAERAAECASRRGA